MYPATFLPVLPAQQIASDSGSGSDPVTGQEKSTGNGIAGKEGGVDGRADVYTKAATKLLQTKIANGGGHTSWSAAWEVAFCSDLFCFIFLHFARYRAD